MQSARLRRTLRLDLLEDRRLLAISPLFASSSSNEVIHHYETAVVSQDFTSQSQSELGRSSGKVELEMFGASVKGEAYGDLNEGKLGVGGEARATFVSVGADGEWESDVLTHGDVDVLSNRASGKGEFFAGAEAGGKSVVDWSNAADPKLEVRGEAFIGEKLSGEGEATSEIIGIDLKNRAEGYVYVGATTEAGASLGREGLNAGAEAFAGDKASGTIGASVGGIGAGLTGEGWAGAGVKAELTGGFNDDGELDIELELGAALGIGGAIKIDITIETNQVVEDAQQFAGNMVSFYEEVAQSQFIDDTAATFVDFGNQVEDTWNDTASALAPIGSADTWTNAADEAYSEISSWFSW